MRPTLHACILVAASCAGAAPARTLASCDVVLVPGHVVGCRGQWTRYPTCPAGWRPCTSLPAPAAPACAADLGGFFVANVVLWGRGGTFQCSPVEEAETIALAGCGARPQRGSATALPRACFGFPLAVPCSPSTAFLCDAAGVNPSGNQSANNGVLCCR